MTPNNYNGLLNTNFSNVSSVLNRDDSAMQGLLMPEPSAMQSLLMPEPAKPSFGLNYMANILANPSGGTGRSFLQSLLTPLVGATQMYSQQLVNNRKMRADNAASILDFQKTQLEMEKLNQEVNQRKQMTELLQNMQDLNFGGNNISAASRFAPAIGLALAGGEYGDAARLMGESAKEQLQQEENVRTGKGYETPTEAAVNAEFAKDYISFITQGGIEKMDGQISIIKDVISDLQKAQKEGRAKEISGGVAGIAAKIPMVGELVAPEAVDIKERYESTVQMLLRQILGAAYTQIEGQGVMSRGYNPSLGIEYNLPRMKASLELLERQANLKKRAVRHYEKNRNLNTFRLFENEKTNSLQNRDAFLKNLEKYESQIWNQTSQNNNETNENQQNKSLTLSSGLKVEGLR